MRPEPTIGDVLEAVQLLSSHIDGEFRGVDKKFAGVDQKFAGVDQKFGDINEKFKDMLDEMARMKGELREEMGQAESRLTAKIDRFTVTRQTSESELATLRSRTDRHDTFLQKVAKKLDLEYEPI